MWHLLMTLVFLMWLIQFLGCFMATGKIDGISVVGMIVVILTYIPTGAYTEWKVKTENIIQTIEGEKYLVDIKNKNEYVYKVQTYTVNGEQIESYKKIPNKEDGESMKNVTIDCVEIDKNEIARCIIFTRKRKHIIGEGLTTYTKYVFYIPKT